MEVEAVADFISRVGFPTAAAVALFWLLEKRMRDLTKQVVQLCQIQVQLLKLTLRTRQANGGMPDDEKDLLAKLEEHEPDSL